MARGKNVMELQELNRIARKSIMASKLVQSGDEFPPSMVCQLIGRNVDGSRKLLNQMTEDGLLHKRMANGKSLYRRKKVSLAKLSWRIDESVYEDILNASREAWT